MSKPWYRDETWTRLHCELSDEQDALNRDLSRLYRLVNRLRKRNDRVKRLRVKLADRQHAIQSEAARKAHESRRRNAEGPPPDQAGPFVIH